MHTRKCNCFIIENHFRCPATPLPKLTPDGYRIFIYRCLENENSHLSTPDQFMKMAFMNTIISMKGDLSRKLIFIHDFQKISMSLASTLFTSMTKYSTANTVR